MKQKQNTSTVNNLNEIDETAKFSTLVLFCKRPKLNQGKQRLAQDSSAEIALAIAKCLLACAIEDANAWQGPVVIACSSNNDIEWAQAIVPKADVIAQLPKDTAGNLGDRLNYVDSQLRSKGHEQLIIIGTDSPMLNAVHFQSTIDTLQSSDISLSHADDGGVIIMANKKPWPILTDLPWSTEELSRELSQLCQEKNLLVHYAIPGYDVDHVSDLEKLVVDLKNDQRLARQSLLNTINQFFSFN